MTGQISDLVIFDGESYSLIGVHGGHLPTLEDFNIRAISTSTACWRGYQMTLRCTNGELFLHRLELNPVRVEPINGVLPELLTGQKKWWHRRKKSSSLFKAVYNDIKLKLIGFTGGL
ncbi:MAG: hypothetical protein ACTSRA_09230, partial [Promethearchaeota archaeon]